MWRSRFSLSIIFLTLLSVPGGATPRTSVGPSSTTEARILWQEGQAQYAARNYRRAALALERYVARYPGHEGYLHAHYLLGLAQLKLGHYKKAIHPFRYYIDAAGPTERGTLGKLKLGLAYIGTGQLHEAHLISIELVPDPSSAQKLAQPEVPSDPMAEATQVAPPKKKKLSKTNRLATHLHIEALLLKAEANFAMKRYRRSRQATQSALRMVQNYALKQEVRAPLSARAHFDLLRLKSRTCSLLSGKRRLDEGQVRDQLRRRSDCLKEAAMTLKKILMTESTPWDKRGIHLYSEAFRSYQKACNRPPLPPGKRTARELKAYREELTLVLNQDCLVQTQETRELISNWRGSLPPTMVGRLDSLISKLAQP